MSSVPIQRTRVWSAGLRLRHWLLATCALTLLLSGWVLTSGAEAPRHAAGWRDLHLTAGYLLGPGLAYRLALLFIGRTPTDRWRDCLPLDRRQWQALRDMLVFYLTLGRAPLPAWYGHNPLWGPLYLLLFLVLALGVATGLLLARHDPLGLLMLSATPWWLGRSLPEWHAGLAWTTAGFAVAHVLSAFLHDAKGSASEISAMVNGHKIFLPPRTPQDLAARIQVVARRPAEK